MIKSDRRLRIISSARSREIAHPTLNQYSMIIVELWADCDDFHGRKHLLINIYNVIDTYGVAEASAFAIVKDDALIGILIQAYHFNIAKIVAAGVIAATSSILMKRWYLQADDRDDFICRKPATQIAKSARCVVCTPAGRPAQRRGAYM